MEMVAMSASFLAGVMGRSFMSSIEAEAFFALVFCIALRWALVVLMAKPSVLKVVVGL
jgi:hypothetical protein